MTSFSRATLTIAAILVAGCTGGLPSSDEARAAFADELQKQVSQQASVTDFRKIDGLKFVKDGVESYDLEFAAKVEAPGTRYEEDVYVGKVTFIRSERGWRVHEVAGESRARHQAEQEKQKSRAVAGKLNQDLRVIESAITIYELDNYMLPSNEQGLGALIEKPDTEPRPKNWKEGGYLRELPLDPWGNPYRYRNPGLHGDFDIFSLGADNAPGGDGTSADVGNWPKARP